MKVMISPLLALLILSCSSSDPTNGNLGDAAEPAVVTPASDPIPRYSYVIVDRYPHDPDAFTQGLVYEDGFLYEGTGRRGQSSLRRVELESGRVLQRYLLAETFFGEGIAVFGDLIYQLTFTSGIGFIYDKQSFGRLDSISYPTQGWGLTHDGSRLIMSDGSSTLYFRNPKTFEETGRLTVTKNGEPQDQLNELEYVRGEIYANLFTHDLVARISPDTGEICGWVDLRGLLSVDERKSTDVLNGIAYDAENDRLFVTGKLWPWLFEIELIPQS